MKILLYLICVITGVFTFAQNTKMEETFSIDYLKNFYNTKSENEYLSNDEGKFLNNIFEDKRDGFDLRNKKIGFISGLSGNKKYSKTHYFKFLHNSDQKGDLIIFDNIEKKLYNYDGVIIYWSKIAPTKKSIKRTLKKKIN